MNIIMIKLNKKKIILIEYNYHILMMNILFFKKRNNLEDSIQSLIRDDLLKFLFN